MDIPNSMKYALRKSQSVDATTILRQFASGNGSSFNTATNEIRINVSADGFLDGSKSYLYFTIKNLNQSASQALLLDSDALSWVDQIRIESQGAVLERIERCGVYNNVLGKYRSGLGKVQARNAKCGGPPQAANMSLSGAEVNETKQLTVTCPIPSGFLHGHQGRAIPQGTNFDIVIRVNSTAKECFKWETEGANLFSIENPRFYAPVYRINNPDVMGDYGAALMERGISWSGDIAKTYINSIQAGTGPQPLQINDRSESLKSFVSVMRETAVVNLGVSNSQSTSILTGLTEMRYVIAGQNYPQDSILYSATAGAEDCARLYEEAQKALATGNQTHCEPNVSFTNFNSTDGVMAVDLRKFDDETLSMTGLNTAATASPNLLHLQLTSGVASEVVTFAICDAVFTLDGRGSVSVRS